MPPGAKDSLHVPSQVLLLRGSLFVHPYPERLHPFKTHELSIGELTAASIAEGNHLRFYTKAFHRPRVISKQGRQEIHNFYGPRDERTNAGFALTNIPVLAFEGAVFCLVLNTMVPRTGELIN